MRGNYYDWKVKQILAETMRRLAEAGEEVTQSNAIHQNTDGNKK